MAYVFVYRCFKFPVESFKRKYGKEWNEKAVLGFQILNLFKDRS